MKRFFWIPFCLLLALFGAALLNAAVADGLVTDWCAELDKLQDTAQAENWDSVRDNLSALHESWDAHATYFHIILQHDELNEVESLLARADSFAFEQDEEISTHTADGDALVTVLDGTGRFTIDGEAHLVSAGESIVMPAHVPHAVYGQTRFKMLLTVIV